MASLNRSTQKNRPAKSQRATTLEMVRHACPDSPQALRISESFGLAIVDSDGIRELHRGQLIESADGVPHGAILALALTLTTSVRRRRRDLALLKTLGFTRRQLAATVAAQASIVALLGIVVGVPVGIVAGRSLWTRLLPIKIASTIAQR